MDANGLQKNKQKEQVELSYSERQQAGWETAESFHKTAKIDDGQGAKYSRYDSMDMFALRDELVADKDSKSFTYTAMQEAIDELTKLAAAKGQVEDGSTADFFEKLFAAQQSVNQYLYTHAGYRWTGKGERRIQITLRLKSILNSLDKEIEIKTADRTGEAARKLEYDKEQLSPEERKEREKQYQANKTAGDIKKIIETGMYGPQSNIDPETAQKMGEKWVIGGYTEKLTGMIENLGDNPNAEEMDDFLAFLEDQNNRMLANRMTITIMTENAKSATLNIPALNEVLKQFITDRLSDEDMTSKPDELAIKISSLVEDFKTQNADRIAELARKRDMIIKSLHLPASDLTLYDYDYINETLAVIDEGEFDQRLNALKAKADENEKIITEILLEGFSIGTRASICKKLFKNLGALRIFGTEDQVRDQTYNFIEMLKYTAPQEYLAERTLANVMKDLSIDKLRRDSFLIAITGNHPEVLRDYNSDFWKVRGEEYSKRHLANSKTYAKLVDKSGLYLNEEQWEALEKAALDSGVMKESEFKSALAKVTSQNKTGKLLSRKEYLTKRQFNDARKEPARLRRARAERDLLDSYGDSFEDRFLLNMSGAGENPYEAYRKLDAAYKGTKTKLKATEEDEKRRYDERINTVNKILSDNGFTVADRKAFTDKCKWMISGILEITEDMMDDERLKCERMNTEMFGVRTWEDALIKFAGISATYLSGEGKQQIEDVKTRYENGRRMLTAYDGGKYVGYEDLLMGLPEVYRAFMNGTPEYIGMYLATELDVRLEQFMKGLEGAKSVPDAVRRQYAYSYLRQIYDRKMEGDAASFAGQIKDYYNKVLKVEPDGGSSVEKNLKAVEKYLEADYKKRGISSSLVPLYKVGVLSLFWDMMKDTEKFNTLFDSKKVMELAKARAIEVESGVKENEHAADVHIEKQFTDILGPVDEKKETAIENIKAEKKKGIKNRLKYLGVDTVTIENIRLGKSLVRVGAKGTNRVNLNTGKADSMRARIQKLCGNLDLPPVLCDALVEEGASESATERLTGLMWSDDDLIRHATAMNKMYRLLLKPAKDDKAMSEEEAQIYIVKCYSDKSTRRLFTSKTGPDVAALRKEDSYKTFRADYEALKKFEALESDDPSLERERIDMARNLRTMLITGIGKAKGSDLSYSETVARNTRYMERSIKIAEYIRDKVDEEIKSKNYLTSAIARDHRIFAIRQYFLNKVVADCMAKDEFDADAWKAEVDRVSKDPLYWDNMEFRRDSISNVDYEKAQSARIESGATEADIANAIKQNTYLFKGRVNKYEKLDNDQKKFFAVALMLMDKGTIGMDSMGTSALLTPKEAKTKVTSKIEEEIAKYVAGEPYEIDVDYREAFNKLINYGETKFFFMESYTLSKTAYDKALQFAQAITAKKQAFGEKDVVRLNDGVSSINAAYTKYGKNQQQEVEKYRDEYMTADSVRNILKSYAEEDTVSYRQIAKKTGLAVLAMGSRAAGELDENLRMRLRMQRIAKRFGSMDNSELKMFVRIMQDRTVLDKTTIAKVPDGPEYADQEKRNALLEALCADTVTRSEVLAGFDDNESCHKAIISALSFQLRDDINFMGKDLTKDHFEKTSFNRKTKIDWDLVDRAFSFIDEVKERRASVYALRHAADYIEQSGNKKAIEENRKLENQYKDKEKFSISHFEAYIRKQAEADLSEQSDVDRIVAGYHSLTDKEKNLFFKVLARRDLLDISKKDYKKNFFGIKDRNYVNQAERDKLIDQYIDASLEDGVGIMSAPGDYYDAMKSLFSTQISDREKFTSSKQLKSMMAKERNLFMGRTTAIDWKLFRRALNFVNRATEELEYREGNAQLYRGAGLLRENGKISMNYSFLRKNFHNTGNQWARFVGRLFVRTVKEELDTDDILDIIVKGIDIGSGIGSKVLGLSKDGLSRQGFMWLETNVKGLQSNLKAVGKSSSEFEITQIGVKKKEKTEKEKQEEEEEEKKRREELLYYDQLKEGIDNVIAQSKSALGAAQDVAKFIRDNYATRFEAGKERQVYDGKTVADEKNTVVKMTKGAKVDTSKGDFRDKIINANEKRKKIVKTAGDVSMVVGYIPGLSTVQELAKYGAEQATLKFINEKILGQSTDFSSVDKTKSTSEQLKQKTKLLKRSADEYAQNTFRGIVESVIGKENAQSLLDLEQGYYSIKKAIGDQIKATVDGINYAKKCVAHIKNVAKAASGISQIQYVSKNAQDKRAEDEAKLEKAGQKRLSPEQKAKVDKIVKKHRAMGGMSEEISTAVLSFGIAEDVINFAIETAEIAGGKLNAGQKVIAKAVKAGIEFAMYAMRIATDRNALNNYFLETEAGSEVLNKVRSGFEKTGNEAMVKRIDDRRQTHHKKVGDVDTSIVDIISDARGYEHTSELVENTGMSMAQSLVFSASRFNPMAETRLIAITVMSIMGLTKEIGDTSPATVEKLFAAFKMKR